MKVTPRFLTLEQEHHCLSGLKRGSFPQQDPCPTPTSLHLGTHHLYPLNLRLMLALLPWLHARRLQRV